MTIQIKTLPDCRFRLWHGAGRRMADPDTIVLHWTGGEGSAKLVYRVLAGRGLGIHFVVDRDGVVWQMCDTDIYAMHCGYRFNSRSVGIEIVCYGTRRDPLTIPERGRDREVVVERIHGRLRAVARPYQRQMDAVRELVTMLRRDLHIDGPACALSTTMTEAEMTAWRGGVVGHLHLTKRKCDPGLIVSGM